VIVIVWAPIKPDVIATARDDIQPNTAFFNLDPHFGHFIPLELLPHDKQT
jgi:hypothetical protein